MKGINAIFVFTVALLAYTAMRAPLTLFSAHVRVGFALVHDRSFDIRNVRETMLGQSLELEETIPVGPKSYSLHPPLPGILTVPFVAAGITNQVTISVVYGALAAMLAYLLTESFWLTAFFAFGTPFGFEVSGGRSWGMCLTLSCVFTLIALLRRNRPGWVAGLSAGAAALCRYDLVLTWPVYLIFWIRACSSPGGARRSFPALAGIFCLLLTVGLYLGLNQLRFGTYFDHSIATWYAQDPFRFHVGDHGPFSIHYLAYNLYTTIFMAPAFDREFISRPTLAGEALILTSPALVLALRPSLFLGETLLLWAAVILAMGGAMLVWANGFEQFGCRYWIQALPFLLLLMSKEPLEQMGKILIVASILITTVGTLQLRGWM